MGEPARNDPAAVGRSALDGAAWDSAPRSPCRPAGWGATPGRVPHGVAVLRPRRQGLEEAAAGAGLHHQRLEAGDQAGLGEQRGMELWVQDRRPFPGPAARPPPSHWPVCPPAPTPCLSPPNSPTPSLGPSPLLHAPQAPPHLPGAGGGVQQLHVHAPHAVCAVPTGAPEPVPLVLGGGGAVQFCHPALELPRPQVWAQRPGALRLGGPPLGGGLSPWPMLKPPSAPGRVCGHACGS